MEDIRPILKDWKYQPGKISVRKILSKDGKVKIQMRLDLGLLQMETTGRPDGKRPGGYESWLEYYTKKLKDYQKEHQTEVGFELSASDCRRLREEATMYYHRYLASFVIGDYERVLKDTEQNLKIFDLCNRFASKRSDRLILEQYRPYVIMMNVRAKTQLLAKSRKYSLAIKYIKAGLKEIKKLYDDVDQMEDFPYAPEVIILKELGKQYKSKLPATPVKILKRKLLKAIEREDFKEAARIKRQLKSIDEKKKKKKK